MYFPVIGGSEILAKTFMDHLSKKHSVTVYTTNIDNIEGFWNKDSPKIQEHNSLDYLVKRYEILTPSEIPLDKNLERLPLITNHPGPFIPKLWLDLVLKKIDFDLIFVTAFPYDHLFPAFIASKKWNIPIVIAPLIHQGFPELFLNSTRLTILKNSDAIITMTKSEKELLEKFGINSNKLFIIPPGVNEHKNKLDITAFKEKYSIPSKTKNILFVGSKANVKGVIHLVEAMKLVWKKSPDSILILIGSNTKEFQDYLSGQPNKIKKKLFNINLIDDKEKNEAFASCDVFVMPSKSESFGLVYLEAWSHSKPVIGCKIASSFDLIENNKDGLLVEFGNIDELSNAITNLLEDDSMRMIMGKNGKDKSKKFTWPNSLEKFEKLCIDTVKNYTSN